MEFVCFDWNRPVLPTTAEYVVERFSNHGRLDMNSVVIALAGSRAVNRLEELLLERVETRIARGTLDPDWFPPTILTVGRLPELFYPVKRPLADESVQQFTWMAALDAMQKEAPDVLARLVPQAPEPEDFSARSALAKLFARLHRELAGDALDFQHVAETCRRYGIVEETRRWETLAALQSDYLNILEDLGLWDLQTARLHAIKEKEPQTDKTIILVAAVDMNIAQKKILQFVSDKVVSLVFAPESYRDRFDATGCLIPERWKHLPIPLRDEQIEVVASPAEQAIALARWLCERLAASGDRNRFTPEDIVIGVPSEELLPFVQQQLRQAGAKTRAVVGTPIRQSAPWQFLEILLKFLENRRFSDFADFLRHPQVETFLSQKIVVPPETVGERREYDEDADDEPVPQDERQATGDCDDSTGISRVLIEADRYHAMFLPDSFHEPWRTHEDPVHTGIVHDFPLLRAAGKELETLLQPLLHREKRPLANSCAEIDLVLQRFFPSGPCSARAADETTGKALDEVRKTLDRFAAIPETLPVTLTAVQTLEFLMQELRSVRISPPGDAEAIEILGWLDLPCDDAAVVAVLAVNEGIVPSSLSADLFLPDRIRRELGIEDNDRRLSRDVYALCTILATRPEVENVRLIAGRRSRDGTPILPSRLLFACEAKTLAERVHRFFSVEDRSRPVVFPGTLRTDLEQSEFRIPPVLPDSTEIHSMSVTEFRDYLLCPYRYYLRHRLKLDALDDREEELDARKFGNVLHEVLRRFGAGACSDSIIETEISAFLEEQLESHTRELYGPAPRAVIRIQIAQIRARLRAFARWQSRWARTGFRIRHTELALRVPDVSRTLRNETAPPMRSFLDLGDGRKMYLRGVIDRIDVHPESGRWVVFDYKSSDTAHKPADVHLKHKGKSGRPPQWADLQLPLYVHAVRQSSQWTPGLRSLVAGYVRLPKDVSQTGEALLDWDESFQDHAVATAAEIARNVLAGKFGPQHRSQSPLPYEDPYAPICLEQC